MSAPYLALFALLAVGGAPTALGHRAKPIQKVITLLEDMRKEVEEEGEKEKQLFDKFMCYCKNSGGDLDRSLAEAKQQVEALGAKLQSEQAEKTQVLHELQDHKADREGAQKDLNEAAALRDKEAKEYAEQAAESKADISAIGGALTALDGDGEASASLVQLPGLRRLRQLLPRLPLRGSDRDDVAAFLQQAGGDDAPATGQIIGVLKSLADEMQSSLDEATSQEDTAVESFQTLKSAKTQEVEVATEAVSAKTQRVGTFSMSIAQLVDALSDAEEEVAGTTKFIANLKAQCQTREKEFDEQTKARSDELSAISDAIATLSDDKLLPSASSSATLQGEGSAQGLSFFQAAKARSGAISRIRRAISLIKVAAGHHWGAPMSLLSVSLETSRRAEPDPAVLAGVVPVLNKMISILGEEEVQEKKQKSWCDSELQKAESEQKAGEEKAAQLESIAEEASDRVKAMDDEMATIEGEIKAIDVAAAEATEERKKDHEEFLETASENKAAMHLLRKAKNRLNKFYNPAASKEGDEELLQGRHRGHRRHRNFQIDQRAPLLTQIRMTRHASQQRPQSNGVLKLLQQIIDDLEKEGQTYEADEKQANEEYVALMNDSAQSRAQASESLVETRKARADAEAKLADLKVGQGLHQEQLHQAKVTAANIHGQCDALVGDFERREQERAETVSGLKEAKSTLSG